MAIIVLIIVSVAASQAIRPIEAAQEESLGQLMTTEGEIDVQSVDEAIEAEAAV